MVGQAGDGAQALGCCAGSRVDVVLMDIQMPRVNGLVATERILRRRAGARDRPGAADRAARDASTSTTTCRAAAVAGAYAVLYKDVDPEALFETIREAAAYRGEE